MTFIKFFVRSVPLLVGMILTLISLTYLVSFVNYGQEYDEPYFWIFVILFVLGFPLLLWGTNKFNADNT